MGRRRGLAGAQAHMEEGDALLSEGRHAEALAAYDRAAGADPGLADVHGCRGAALAGLGRHDEAAAAFGRAAEIDPGIVMQSSRLHTTYLSGTLVWNILAHTEFFLFCFLSREEKGSEATCTRT